MARYATYHALYSAAQRNVDHLVNRGEFIPNRVLEAWVQELMSNPQLISRDGHVWLGWGHLFEMPDALRGGGRQNTYPVGVELDMAPDAFTAVNWLARVIGANQAAWIQYAGPLWARIRHLDSIVSQQMLYDAALRFCKR